jgi:hypothetical protein
MLRRFGLLISPIVGVVVAVTVSGCAPAAPAASPTAAPPTVAPSSSPTPSATVFLGATGYGALTLGMTKQQALATGLTAGISGTKGTCGDHSDGMLAGAPTPTDAVVGTLFFSEKTNELVAIYAFGSITTPEGIGLGSTLAQLKAAYPSWSGEPDAQGTGEDEGRGYVEVAGGKASYRIAVIDGKVVELSLDSVDQDCYE